MELNNIYLQSAKIFYSIQRYPIKNNNSKNKEKAEEVIKELLEEEIMDLYYSDINGNKLSNIKEYNRSHYIIDDRYLEIYGGEKENILNGNASVYKLDNLSVEDFYNTWENILYSCNYQINIDRDIFHIIYEYYIKIYFDEISWKDGYDQVISKVDILLKEEN